MNWKVDYLCLIWMNKHRTSNSNNSLNSSNNNKPNPINQVNLINHFLNFNNYPSKIKMLLLLNNKVIHLTLVRPHPLQVKTVELINTRRTKKERKVTLKLSIKIQLIQVFLKNKNLISNQLLLNKYLRIIIWWLLVVVSIRTICNNKHNSVCNLMQWQDIMELYQCLINGLIWILTSIKTWVKCHINSNIHNGTKACNSKEALAGLVQYKWVMVVNKQQI